MVLRKAKLLIPSAVEEGCVLAADAVRAKSTDAWVAAILSDSSGSNRTSNAKSNRCFCWLARATFSTNNIDHHQHRRSRTSLRQRWRSSRRFLLPSDEAVWRTAAESMFSLLGERPNESEPLAARRFGKGIRQYAGAKLFILNARDIRLQRKATRFVKLGGWTGKQPCRSALWLTKRGNRPAVLSCCACPTESGARQMPSPMWPSWFWRGSHRWQLQSS